MFDYLWKTSTSTSTDLSLREQLIANGSCQVAPNISIEFSPYFKYHQRALTEFGYIVLYFNTRRITVLLEDCKIGEALQSTLKIPLCEDFPPLYLSGHTTMEDLARAIGLKTYDLALPYVWVEREYLSAGREFPRGVWCYDDNKTWGEFVSMEDMIAMLGEALDRIGVDLVFYPPARIIPEDSIVIPPALLSGLT